MLRPAIYITFTIIMLFLAYHVYNANAVRVDLNNRFASIKSSLEATNSDNKKLESDINYFSDPRNLEKEARARFNYRASNEKTIIVVPPKSGGQ